jgi:hypothetical protein
MRTVKDPPDERADSHATSAVRRLPRCNGPVGLGANRPWGTNPQCGKPLSFSGNLAGVLHTVLPRIGSLSANSGHLVRRNRPEPPENNRAQVAILGG